MPQRRRRFLLAVVDEVLATWEAEDSGIWEARREKRRYLYSQAMCWVALDRALRMERSLRMGRRRLTAARRARDRIKREVLTRGYSSRRQAFTQSLDDETLDATGLTVPLTGMIPATDPRVVSTVDLLRRRLTRGGLVLRYEGRASEFGEDEGAFLICSFWLVDVLAQMGRRAEAEDLFARVTETANGLGLFAEEFDTRTQTMLGNFPQALTHLSLIGAVLNLDRGTVRGSRGATE
jgi:GH15 family glucan-1,4-alpha-glucosidase